MVSEWRTYQAAYRPAAQRQPLPRADAAVHGRAPTPRSLLIQRAVADPALLSQADVRHLQRIIGNRSVQRMLSRRPGSSVQRQAGGDSRALVVQREDDDEAEARKGIYETLPPGMDKYAGRKGELDDFKGDIKGVTEALSLPRLPDGRLSPKAIAIMDALQSEQAQGYVDQSRQGGIVNAPTDKAGLKALKTALKSNDLNRVTGKTRRPELENLLNPVKSKGAEQQVVTPVTVGGVTMHVYHSTADVNFKPRLKSFEAAIKMIEAAMVKMPPTILVHLPKFGGTIDAQTLCETGGTPRAVFNPPNFIHLSPAVVGNPIDQAIGGSFVNLSTELDPQGPASVVHELGHLMHYQKSASSFYGLHAADFNRLGGNLAMKVSGYAAKNPREFVAEVFMGLVYGRTFDDDVIDMYLTYGGPMSWRFEANLKRIEAKKGKA